MANAYVGKLNDQETREQLALDLTALVTQEPAEASVEPADPTELLPIDSSESTRPRANARDLQAYLQIGRDFSNWIKSFINSYKFVENQDFEVIEGLSSPNLASSKARPQRTKEYLLTMDMAKWIALSANNARGYEARRYFPQRNSATDPNPSGCCGLNDPEANWGPGNCPVCAEDDAFLAQVAALTNAYVGKPNDQETREQLSLELTASVTQEPAEASVEPTDLAELIPID